MALYTYRPVIQNGVVAYLREEVTDRSAYAGMPVFPRVSGHNDELRGGSGVPSITQYLLDRDAHAAEVKRREKAATRKTESSSVESCNSPAYNRVMDID